MMDEQLPLLGSRRSSRGLALALLALAAATLLGVAFLLQQQRALLAQLQGRSAPLWALSPVASSVRASPRPPRGSEAAKVLVVHASGPHLDQLAAAVEEGARRIAGAQVRVRTVEQAAFTADVLWADAIVLGSHVVNANVEPKARAPSGWVRLSWCSGLTVKTAAGG